jgi:hypothetical protein
VNKNRGSLFYVVVLILSILAGIAGILIDIAISDNQSTQLAYRSEIALNLSEAISEEFFRNMEAMMNTGEKGPIGGVYDKLREEVSEGEVIPISNPDHITKYLAPHSLQLCKELGQCQAFVEAQIKDIRPININPRIKGQDDQEILKPGVVVDRIEKDAVLELLVEVKYQGYAKRLVVTRSLKVVKTVMEPLSLFTLFINEPGFPNYSQWASKFGMAYHKKGSTTGKERDQSTLIFDHGWDDALGKPEISIPELRQGMEDRVLQGKVPPGRVFLNTGIVPLTNGNREAGMLQNAFFSAESELLPPPGLFDLEDKARLVGAAGSQMSDTEKKLLESVLPESGKVFTRYLGYGAEIRGGDDLVVNGKERMGFESYFEAFISAWSTSKDSQNPSKSGLDLFGRVEYKPGVLEKEDEETGIFGKIINAVGDITDAILNEFVNNNYNLRVSPTIVYGKALSSYFRVMDYKYTRGGELKSVWKRRKERQEKKEKKGFWESLWDGVTEITSKLLNTIRIGVLGPGQIPIPEFPDDFLDGIPESEAAKPFTKADRAKFPEWSQEGFESFLDLPDGLRTPLFFKFLREMRKSQQSFFGQDLSTKIPRGAILAPYNNSILNYLKPDIQESQIIKIFTDDQKGAVKESKTGQLFFDNPMDQELSRKWGPDYRSPFEGILEPQMPLQHFNPFLYYRKATEYISSIYDYRSGKRGEGVNVLREKYFNEKDQVLDFNGVIYITGTARPLRFSEFLPQGKKEVEFRGKAIIITFGEVIFDCSLRKSQHNKYGYNPRWGAEAPLLTVVALGGVQFVPDRKLVPVTVEATVYSFMYPPRANHEFRLHGTLGASELKLRQLPRGGVVKFDPSFYLRDVSKQVRKSYYWVALTDEIKEFSWKAGW